MDVDIFIQGEEEEEEEEKEEVKKEACLLWNEGFYLLKHSTNDFTDR